jgi:hypothetical protein
MCLGLGLLLVEPTTSTADHMFELFPGRPDTNRVQQHLFSSEQTLPLYGQLIYRAERDYSSLDQL